MNKHISKTAVLLSALAGTGYGIYHQNIWMAVAGFFVAGAVVLLLEWMICGDCKTKQT